ncbi:MAG: Ig-like domain-containing protein [Prevotella sp.]|uniref:SbsA Ig-like domain-containing protein n=2 Tax=Xylanibacter caecicola TaxID=2736294 RepID=A0ABX2B264_9BACT|nr:Ig-like domain-containing protein [Prevotella sp.]NPE24513.1 hypothetical protein [Xylanibacter caecicola]
MGQPDGGLYDETPPRIVGATPADKAVGVSPKKVTIYFDEYITVDNPTEKVVVSPPQIEMPEIKGAGKKIVVELRDSLKPATTYTIDFSDAISDNNEGNPLGNYTYSFSTGDHIDTLEVAGSVVDASNLEPVKGILVGLYPTTPDMAFTAADTAFTTTPFLRVSRTDSRGRFIVKGVAPGQYRIYALQDMDNNYFFSQKSEMLAFSRDIIVPACKPDVRQDTLWRDSLHIDSIVPVRYTHFLPDDIVLKAFTEVQTDRYFLKSERQKPEAFTLFFSNGDSRLPEVRGLNFDDRGAFVVEASEKNDTVTYWLRDTALVNTDTLRMEVRYMGTDTLGALVSNTDTLEILPRESYEKRMKRMEREREEWQKKQEKARKRGDVYLTEMPAEALEPEYDIESEPAPDRNITVVMPSPLARIDTAAIHLYSRHDTLWYRSPMVFREREGKPRTYELLGEWRPGTEYSLEIDSAAFTDIYGRVSGGMKKGFRVRTLDSFGSLIMTVEGMADTAIVVELLDTQDRVVKSVRTSDGTAEFFYIKPATYYMRMFVDSNGNGKWDTGDYAAGRQPEEMCYYPERIECKAKWDISLSWNPLERAGDRQKPMAITKQKPDKEKTIKRRNEERN